MHKYSMDYKQKEVVLKLSIKYLYIPDHIRHERSKMDIQRWKDHITQLIQENKVHTVRICMNDNSNTNRSRYVSVQHFLDQAMENGISLTSVVFSFDTAAEINEKIGDGYKGGFPSWIIKPDIHTFGVVPYSNGTARVIADVYDSSLNPIAFAPRYVLKKVLELYEQEGIKVRGAFEYEFYVCRRNSDGVLEPIWDGKQCYSEIKQHGVENIIKDVMLNLSAMGAGPEVANTEYASGQFEVTNSPFWGIEIADMAFYYRTSIKEIIEQKGMLASFMAKPAADRCGNGAHIHISLYDKDDRNLLRDEKSSDGLSSMCHSFIAGQIKHANALCALINPTVNSYKRLTPYAFAPTTKTWGYEHRGAMIRIPFCRNENTRIENRLPGADTNPYITLAALLAAGLEGIKNKLQPPAPCTGTDTYKDIENMLPNTLINAISELKNDTYFANILGEDFVRQYIILREGEWERYMKHISDWELSEYLELI